MGRRLKWGHGQESVCSWFAVPAGMLGYGLAKAAVHQLVESLADPKSGLPSNSAVVGILP